MVDLLFSVPLGLCSTVRIQVGRSQRPTAQLRPVPIRYSGWDRGPNGAKELVVKFIAMRHPQD
jgi:hypothetical protein